MANSKILVVEDEIVIAMDLQATLVDLGYDVPEIVTSGEEAIHTALAMHPDLVLMDINLSQALDGIDAAQEIIQRLDIPVIYLTAYADDETLQRAQQTKPFGYLLKPFDLRELKANVEIAFYKHQVDRRLKQNQQWLLGVLSSISEGVAATDANGLIKFLNPVAEALTGWSEAEAIGKTPEEVLRLIDELTQDLIENPVVQALKQCTEVNLTSDVLLSSKTGKTTPVMPSAAPIRNPVQSVGSTPDGAVMVFRDISEQRYMKQLLEYNAMHDHLTKLPNRALLFDRLQHAVQRAKRNPEFGFAVMLLDLDRFKIINDTFGHLVGDQLLIAIAPRLVNQLRSVDTIARLGGDEFAILMENVNDPAIASRAARRIIQAVSQSIHIDDQELLVSASLGIVLSSIPYDNATDLLRDADIAMYRAKAKGGHGFELFDSTMHEQAKQQMQLEHGLRQAILQNEFRVHYQPIVELASRRLDSLEALVRWQKSGSDMVLPGQFIPLAEEVGLVAAIDQWVMRESCRQLQTWQLCSDKSLPQLSVNVNVSSKQICQENFLSNFEQVIDSAEDLHQHVKLEVTESVFMQNIDQASGVFKQLKSLGVQICLDDFGTGYSSLSYLHRLPIDIVKIDRSFIQGMHRDPEKLEIVRAITGLCRTLDKTVVAEGIETNEQHDMLLDLGCEYGQGYLFSRPVSQDSIQQWLCAAPEGVIL
ncbi:MAG: EAL domain-containing protein [Cyanobacteria bacterium P01_C01_bin.120]